ncbi:acyl carrier protein [Teichococcus oryzae]|uniref:Acyl carrier protein n=1 Tax=Teichococcus oryzae TaxID=1608942 RepID=A0A5B2TCB4_9PROT|nr:acyl carrier protein [Pseudoroseomonas oryzae]KAA2212156.1 acyl carrier protein [Pseudoroseomonas oryzae]
MSQSEIYIALTEVFQEVFDDDSIVLTPETTADDIEGWDSQAHVSLVVAAESQFGVRFRTADLETLHNVGDFVALIEAKREAVGHG